MVSTESIESVNFIEKLTPGTFAEVGNLIRSLTQVLYDRIQDVNDQYWLWLIDIRSYLRYMLMPKISTTQV